MVINLTPHKATPEQLADNVYDLDAESYNLLITALTFLRKPSMLELLARASAIVDLVGPEYRAAMIDCTGCQYLLSYLEEALKARGVVPLYSFSQRIMKQVGSPFGGNANVTVHAHVGFVKRPS